MAFGERLEHRHALGADGQPVGGVLDVAAGDDRRRRRLERGADLEPRIGGLRVTTRARRAQPSDARA